MSSHRLSQRQIQTLRLSPQQILYTKLLQLPVLQLEQRVKQELEENPLLEEGQENLAEEQDLDEVIPSEMLPEPDSLHDALNGAAQSPLESTLSENQNEEKPSVEKKREEEKAAQEENDFDAELAEALNNDDDEGYKVQQLREPSDDEREYLQPTYEENFSERLLAQLYLLDLSEKELQIAEEIIGNLDSDGYLRCTFEIIQDGLLTAGIETTEKEIEAVLEKIWYLDPPGVGARNLQECLLIQLTALAKEDLDDEHEDARTLAQKILSHHYNDFIMKHYEKLLQDLACSPDELKRAVAFIQKLNPKPGGDVPSRVGNYVIPDFTITFNGQDLVLTSNERANIQIRISKHYKKLMSDKAQSKETKEFLREKLAAAKGFISAIQMRRYTMQKVMTAIMNRQYDFFVHGESRLKPMVLKDIAEDTQLDIATISRVVSGKYVQTDFGVFELKYFFTTAVETESGDEVSNRIIKQAIKDFIEKEESGKPLSDDKLAEMLNERGYKLARRTVTKYREQLGIPVARLRKKIESIK
ncbi:MAG: RNA polymerase factor sigma-54 [Chloroherpetonaceae bacterium]